MEAVMSALSAIETLVTGAPDAHDGAGAKLASRERPLRVLAGPEPSIAAAAHGTAADNHPRSSSNQQVGSRPLVGRRAGHAGPRFAAALDARPVAPGAAPTRNHAAAASVLTGTIVPAHRQRPRPAADAGEVRAKLRLTRRGRVVVASLVVVAVTLAVLLITMLASGGAQATNHGKARAGYQGMHQVVVRPGQTLWSLASAAEPTADPRNVVQQIMSANALGSPSISAGQLLWVP
jgi:hypothetical protein